MMLMHPKQFIARVRDLFPESYAPYSGGCLKFHFLLKMMYPQAAGYYNSNHVITEIDEHYYDITGEVKCTADYAPITGWSKAQLRQQFQDIDSPFIKSGIDTIGR